MFLIAVGVIGCGGPQLHGGGRSIRSGVTELTDEDTATFVSPADGALDVDAKQPISWTAVSDADAYYLYVGTSSGAKDLVDTGEIQSTSYFTNQLPSSQPLYARIYTKHAGAWSWSDSTFTIAPTPVATLVYPADGDLAADTTTRPITWTAADGAQAYYLYVGTSRGAKDVVDSGEIQSTSLLAPPLAAGQTLYARIYTEIDGHWLYSDSTFASEEQPPATFVYPTDGATGIDASRSFEWTSNASAQAYRLAVGTSPGADDLIDSGEISATSYDVHGRLPPNQTLYARLYTEQSGHWYSSDASFTAAAAPATFVNPLDGASAVDQSQPFRWTPMAGASAYYLYVGTTRGAKDLVDSGEIQSTSLAVSNLPVQRPLYARIYTEFGGSWLYSDAAFTIAATPHAAFTFPSDGANTVDGGKPFTWTAVAGAQAYYLTVGTTLGGRELVDSGEMQGVSYTAVGLPTQQLLHARIYTEINGGWLYSDISFTISSSPLASLIGPADGAVGIGTQSPFYWSTVSGAASYYLYVGTQPETKDVFDSGELPPDQWSFWFIPGLAPNTHYYATLFTLRNGVWTGVDSSFTTGVAPEQMTPQMSAVLSLADQVRSMADDNNHPMEGTPLQWVTQQNGRSVSACSDYAMELLLEIGRANIGQARELSVCLNDNSYDCHTLIEVYYPPQSQWVLVDPTFDLVPHRASDGGYATAGDMSAAVHAMDWSQITYQYLSAAGSAYARNYYLDYPLLFMDIFQASGPAPNEVTALTEMPFLTPVVAPIVGQSGSYLAGLPSNGSVALQIDGTVTTLTANGPNSLTYVFAGTDVTPLSPDVQLYSINRYVF